MTRKHLFRAGVVTINLGVVLALALLFDLSALVPTGQPSSPVAIPDLRGTVHYVDHDALYLLPDEPAVTLSYWA